MTTSNDDARFDALCRVWGWGGFGILRVRLLILGNYRTFWHVAIGRMMFGVALPPKVQRWLEREGRAR